MSRSRCLALITLASCAPSPEFPQSSERFDERRSPLSSTGRMAFTVLDESGSPVQG